MREVDFFQVDAFTKQIFGGNPAAVCHLQEWMPDKVLQAMACEHNQTETAFFVSHGDEFELRWFTTAGEIDLCGHATLASANVIFNHLKYPRDEIRFSTRFVGPIAVRRKDDWLTLDFPSWIPEPLEIVPEIALQGLGVTKIQEAYIKRDYLFVFENEEDICSLQPDFQILSHLNRRICVTSPGKNCDFVSRFFPARKGATEDPVTGSAHSMLIPFWAKRFNKTKMYARQLSERGGELLCEILGERVLISGQACTYMQGKIFIPEAILSKE